MNSTVTVPEMALQKLRVKVAELCGWTAISECFTPYRRWTGWPPDWPGFSKASYSQQMGQGRDIPDYPNDVNVCHEFEKTLTFEQCGACHQQLEWILADDTHERNGKREYPAQDFWFHATAEMTSILNQGRAKQDLGEQGGQP